MRKATMMISFLAMKLDWKMLGLGLLVLSQMKKKAKAGTMSVQKGTALSLAELRDLAQSVGFPDPDVAAAVAMAESGGFESNVGDSGKSLGLWQVHTPSWPNYDTKLLLTKVYNAQAALEIRSTPKGWGHWSTYNDGLYLKYMPPGPQSAASGEAPKPKASAPAVAPAVRIELEDDERTDIIDAPEANGHA